MRVVFAHLPTRLTIMFFLSQMLAACLDAAGSDGERLLNHVSKCLKEGLPQLAEEFKISCRQVWRGSGSIRAKHVAVESIYHHRPAPVPASSMESSQSRADHHHDHHHCHSHSHSHSHSHENHREKDLDEVEVNAESNNDNANTSNNQQEISSHSHHHHHDGPLRNLPEIRQMLLDAEKQWIPAAVRETAIQCFTELAIAEATVHGADSSDAVHFHEVGAVDSIVDTIGTLLALHCLGVETVSCSRLPLGEGHVRTAHGILPVPAPATLRLMIGMPTTKGPPGWTGELVTPTGAALLRVLTNSYTTTSTTQQHIPDPTTPSESTAGKPPPFTLLKVGIGAGTKNFKQHPNIVRLMVGVLA